MPPFADIYHVAVTFVCRRHDFADGAIHTRYMMPPSHHDATILILRMMMAREAQRRERAGAQNQRKMIKDYAHAARDDVCASAQLARDGDAEPGAR